jgi:hypothetical protein
MARLSTARLGDHLCQQSKQVANHVDSVAPSVSARLHERRTSRLPQRGRHLPWPKRSLLDQTRFAVPLVGFATPAGFERTIGTARRWTDADSKFGTLAPQMAQT